MAEAFFSFEPFSYGRSVHDTHVPLQYNKGAPQMQVFPSSEEEDWGDLDFLCSQYSSYPDYIPPKGALLSETPQPPSAPTLFSDFGLLDDFQFNTVSPSFQTPEDSVTLDSVLSELSDIIQLKNEKTYPKPMASLELLHGYKSGGYNKMNGGKISEKPTQTRRVDNPQRLSTEEVMRVAGAQYIQFAVRKDDHNLSMLSHPFGCSFSGLSDEETQEVELAHLLLASAEKIGNQQYDRGNKLRSQCAYMSSSTGSPVQRIAYYFSQALLERINRETGRISSMGGKRRGSDQDVGVVIDIEEEMLCPNPAIVECHQVLPFSQVLLFPGVQAIVESVCLAKKVHVIDLGIKTGVSWTILMQALAVRHECPLEMLKVTAVGTKSQHELRETGKRLTSFAESMNIPFLFKLVMVTNLEDLKEDMIELEEDDAVAISAPLVLRTLLTRSDSLDSLMRVIRNLNPCIMVVIEVEANHNSPSFFNRFIEALFYFSAYFDCFEACMDRNNNTRLTIEALYFGQAIMNIVAMEGEERTHRHVGMDVWRQFFARFGMVEMEFSHSSTYQANLISKQFSCGSSCTVAMNERCLTVGWKGTPLHSLSAWKFR